MRLKPLLLVRFSALVCFLLLRACRQSVSTSYGTGHVPDQTYQALYAFDQLPDMTTYIQNYRTAIAAARPNLREQQLERIASYPLFSSSERPQQREAEVGIILIHGLTETPFTLRDIQNRFQAKGYPAVSLLLPGHGLKPRGLLTVSHRDWIAVVTFALNDLRRYVDQVIIVGHSLGCALAIHAARAPDHQEFIKALILISPTLKISCRALLVQWSRHLGGKWSWLEIRRDDNLYKYESFPAYALYEAYQLTQLVAASQQPPISIPVFLAASAIDTTVLAEGTLAWFRQLAHPLSKAIIYSPQPIANPDPRMIIFNPLDRKRRILGLSHLAIPVAPENPYYGAQDPQYINCLHYYNDRDRYERCKAGDRVYYGETSQQREGVIRRLTYNPYLRLSLILSTPYEPNLTAPHS